LLAGCGWLWLACWVGGLLAGFLARLPGMEIEKKPGKIEQVSL
jgi:hypothetical protein